MLNRTNITNLIQIEVVASHYLVVGCTLLQREFNHPKITLDQRGKCKVGSAVTRLAYPA